MLSFFKKILKLTVAAAIIGMLVVVALVYHYSRDLPDYSTLKHYHPPAVTRIYSSDGKLIEEYAKEHRVFVPISAIPSSLIEAFLAAEDSNFYNHPGIDIPGVMRAAVANIFRILQNKRMEGASTITQQVVKNFFLTSEQSIARKVKEAVLAYMITRTFTKDQILELYLNQMYLGKGAYGVAAASQTYFNKSVNELTLEESAFIAALPKAPSAFDPDKRYDRILARRNYVIGRMVEDGYIKQEAADEAMKLPITLIKRDKSETVTAHYYAETVREKIIEIFGQDMFYTGGLTVITSMNTKYQEQAEKSLRKGIRDYDLKKGYRGPIAKISVQNWEEELKAIPIPPALLEYKLAVILDVSDVKANIGLTDKTKHSIAIDTMKWAATNLKSAKTILKPGDVVAVEEINKTYALRQIPAVNGAFMAMNPYTGQVLAMVGGYEFNTSKFNRATQALRQPGSSIKPFVYLAALENNIPPNALFDDAPIALPQGPGMPLWKPKNFEGNFLGPITMRKALEKSRNLVTVRITQQVGVEKVAELIKRFGINSNPPHYLSMCLGALETTVDRMASAYSAITNGGTKVIPQYIEVIKDSNGKIIYKRDSGICNCELPEDSTNILPPPVSVPQNIRLADEADIYQITSLMNGVIVRGSAASRAKNLTQIMAGKTGTTNESMDTWFMGFTPKLLTVTYIGHDTPKTLGKRDSGATVALPVFVDFMQKAYKDEPSLPFKKPDSIVEVMVDAVTGKPTSESCGILEAFKKGSDPKEYIPNNNSPAKENESNSGIY